MMIHDNGHVIVVATAASADNDDENDDDVAFTIASAFDDVK